MCEQKPPLAWWNVDLSHLWLGNRALAEMMKSLGKDLFKLKEIVMATKEEILAKVNEQHGLLKSIQTTVDALNGEFADIKGKIDDLQRQIDEGQQPDLTELSNKVDEVSATIAEIMPAIKANP